jgi:glycosyltransferase involved in cell wall biosynthesis
MSSPHHKHAARSVVIFQRVLMHYRVPLFNALSEALDGRLTVCFCEPGAGVQESQLRFTVCKVQSVNRGPLRSASGVTEVLAAHDIVVTPLDIHELLLWRCAASGHDRRRTVAWGHSHGNTAFSQRCRRWLAGRCGAVVVYTDEGRSRLEAERFDVSRVFVANNTVEVANAAIDRETARTSFVFSGRLTSRKEVDSALAAFAGIPPQLRANAKFEIVGGGSEKRRLQDLAGRLLPSSSVVFHDEIYDPEALRSIFHRSLAYVSPGHVGLGLLHSFAYGVPVITKRDASHAPEFSNLVDGENSLLYDGTLSELEACMTQLLQRPERSLELGCQAYQHFQQQCSITQFVHGFLSAFRCLTEIDERTF